MSKTTTMIQETGMVSELDILQVCDRMCDQCLYGSNSVVEEGARAVIMGDQDPSHWFICHKSTIAGMKVMCRGYYEANKETSVFIKLGRQLGLINFVRI